MKKLLIASIVFFSFNKAANGQTNIYHPFPDSNAVWNIHFGWYCFWNGTADENYSITLSGDTVINSQTYHKLTTPYVESFSTGTCGGISTGYKGAIRQDTSVRKVFFIPPADSTEQLLYDFTMQVGDTVKGYIEAWAFPPDIVLSIDSILVGSRYHKRWTINSWYQIYLIEGIGSTYGLIERSLGNVADYPDFRITCFQQNQQSLFPDTTTDCQLIMTSVISPVGYFDLVNISPNPFTTHTTLQANVNLHNATLAVYNSFGQQVKQINNISGQTITLHRNNLPSGLYFTRLTTPSPSGEGWGEVIATEKIVITDN